MKVSYMEKQDKAFVMSIDKHVNDTGYDKRVYTKTGYVMWEKNVPIGLMHYSVIFASQSLAFWEEDMKQQGYKMVLLSTQVDEEAQNIYRLF